MQVYVSGVTAEVGSYCAELTAALQRAGAQPVLARHDGDAHDPLPRIAEMIAKADHVVCLLGNRCGHFPDTAQVQAVGDVPYQHNFCADNGVSEASFTQWELLLACQAGVPVIAVELAARIHRDGPNPERGDRQTDQRAFKRWVAELAVERLVVEDAGDIVPAVLGMIAGQTAADVAVPAYPVSKAKAAAAMPA